MNHLGIDVGKRKCRAALKDDKGKILDEFFFGNDGSGIYIYFPGYSHMEIVLLKSSIRIYRKHVDENSRHTVEDNGIDTILANPYKTRIIAEAKKIKSDKL